jgi:PAS domain S-box-containing protein
MGATRGIGQGRERAVLDLFETTEVIAMALDRSGRITYCNAFLAEITGWDRDALIGRDYFATFEPYRPAGAMEELLIRAGSREASPVFDETVVYGRGDERRIVSWSDTLTRDDEGRVVGTTSIGQDVTDRSRAQTRLTLQLDIARSLAAATSVEEAALGVFSALGAAFPVRAGMLWLVDGDELRPAAAYGTETADGGVAREALARCGLAWDERGSLAFPAVRNGEVVAVVEVGGDPEMARDAAVRGSLGGIGNQVAQFLLRLATEAELRLLVEQQAALLRVAALVTREGGEELIVDAVTEEVGRLFGAQHASTARYGDDGTAVIVGGWNENAALREPSGFAVRLDDDTSIARVWRTGAPARVDDYATIDGPQVEYLRHKLGLRASVAAPITLGGRLWGALSAATTRPVPFPARTEERLAQFGELIAQALANAEAAGALAASRLRLLATADAERRRLERNLHDGAQQRLVALALSLRLAENRVRSDPDDAIATLAGARVELGEALEELRELARGIHPAVLSDHGLRAAIPALAARCPLPVDIDVELERLPQAVEVAAYFAVSEALANVVKYAGASRVTVVAVRQDHALEVTVTDDGVGGADPSRGSGLQGLADRVDALGGSIAVASPPGGGTQVAVRLPVR